MRVTIFGATGLLGKALMREWKEDDVTGFGSADGDIRDSEQVLRLVQRGRPDWIVLAAAFTDVDGCETNRDLAFNVNYRGAVNVAQAAKQHGARLLFLSTDYVFDGAKTTPYATGDPRSPHSVYGQSKAEAEAQLADSSAVLYRADFVALRRRRKMFPRHHSEAGCDPATAGSSGRPARLSHLLSGSGSRSDSAMPPGGEWHGARHQPRCVLLVRICAGKSLPVLDSTQSCAKLPATSSSVRQNVPSIPCCRQRVWRSEASQCLVGRTRCKDTWLKSLDVVSNHVGTDVLICPAERSSANLIWREVELARLDR